MYIYHLSSHYVVLNILQIYLSIVPNVEVYQILPNVEFSTFFFFPVDKREIFCEKLKNSTYGLQGYIRKVENVI